MINFELPHEPESYVHRIGRTARNGTTGVAWSLVEPAEGKQLGAIERLQRTDIPRLNAPEGFATVALQTQGPRAAEVAVAEAAVHAVPRLARPGPALATALAGYSAALTLRKKVAPKDGPRRRSFQGERGASGESRGHKGGAGRGGKPNGGRRFGAAPRAPRNRPSAA